jgi:hypothetical protein
MADDNSSVSQTIEQRYANKLVYCLSLVDDVTALWTSVFYPGWKVLFKDNFERNGRRVYLEHYRKVQAQARDGNHQLLDYQVGDGWKPLCEFLGLPVPEQSFPKGNDQASFHASARALDWSRTWAVTWKVVLLSAGCVTATTLAFGNDVWSIVGFPRK